ncbi:TetR family transcriptional regulator [Mycolicibacterium moriokaense]|uniref:Transcriptional regulator, TetR family protein n=1 Tax=Mycolicibacterium moriokaense TaxID=39691 RepID=A0AAD1M8K1_9MYCO|nr:TetR/AcrR family transcriptional regulator [Mycolicibacterium moriokaense]MCV7038774.1 TetR/AcrR family transcriptional regulator [Mycolicibacterium moriokaense]ORB25375.1 TetR family transcriptional regulator [Mycolicibacterium moriokaense]BBX03615.1 putative transcriptional regulator, TetR family protein [Mycolicibacterium moriokaense]
MPRRKDGSGLSRDVDEAREQILAAAEVVILRYGIPKTTMDDIGREAGVSRPTVYRYFGDREALVGALIERRSRMLFERARTFILSHETFAEQLIEGLVYLVDHGRKDPIVRILVSPEHMGMTRPIVGGSNLATNLTAEMWEPIFRRAMERGEVRRDLDIAAVAEWLALVQFILVGRLDFASPEDPNHREMLRTFVLPAFSLSGERVTA